MIFKIDFGCDEKISDLFPFHLFVQETSFRVKSVLEDLHLLRLLVVSVRHLLLQLACLWKWNEIRNKREESPFVICLPRGPASLSGLCSLLPSSACAPTHPEIEFGMDDGIFYNRMCKKGFAQPFSSILQGLSSPSPACPPEPLLQLFCKDVFIVQNWWQTLPKANRESQCVYHTQDILTKLSINCLNSSKALS